MLGLLAANPYLGIEEVNYDDLRLFALSIVALAVALFIFRMMGILKEKARLKKSAWNTFTSLAKIRGLNTPQIAVLTLVARKARLKSPARILGSLRLFDRSVERCQEEVELDEQQQILIEAIRKKLSTAKEIWSEAEGDRRQLARARCSWNAHISLIARTAIEKEMFRGASDDSDDDRLIEAAMSLSQREEAVPYSVQISDISAGGFSLLASSTFTGNSGDIAVISGESQRIPFTVEGICAQLRGLENDEERGLTIVHMSFLLLEQELRREIIHFVYEKAEKDKKRSLRPEHRPSAKQSGSRSPRTPKPS